MHVIDSHTEGEPTRVIVQGGPDLGDGPLRDRLGRLRESADEFRRFSINEPRGWDAMVGALLCEPDDPSCEAGVIFFNNTGYLGMCGHGTIGVAVTLHHLGRIGLGTRRFQTPVGVVTVNLSGPNQATFENVPSYRYHRGVSVAVEGYGSIVGDVAWGGNWFFMAHESPVSLLVENTGKLVALSSRVKDALADQGITGSNGSLIDHVEFSEDRASASADSRNFVMCPGGAYDRSPCGTGTSAKLACLAADGALPPSAPWVQESVSGGRFVAKYRRCPPSADCPDSVHVSITGRAFICGDTTLIRQLGDPLGHGGIPIAEA